MARPTKYNRYVKSWGTCVSNFLNRDARASRAEGVGGYGERCTGRRGLIGEEYLQLEAIRLRSPNGLSVAAQRPNVRSTSNRKAVKFNLNFKQSDLAQPRSTALQGSTVRLIE